MISYLTALSEAIRSTSFAQLDTLLQDLKYVRDNKNVVFIAGNGGSYSVAEHWGVDLAKAACVRARTLGTNPAFLTAMSNDEDYSLGFSTELSLHLEPGDLVVCLSCSGTSNNIAAVLREVAKAKNVRGYLITGPRAPEYPRTKTIRVMSDDYGILEDVFSAIGHWLTRELA